MAQTKSRSEVWTAGANRVTITELEGLFPSPCEWAVVALSQCGKAAVATVKLHPHKAAPVCEEHLAMMRGQLERTGYHKEGKAE